MTFLETLQKTLLQDERFIAEDGRVLKAKVYDAAMAMDGNLLHLLLSEEVLKGHFFKKVNDTLVFDKVEFTWVLNSREFLPDSYTMYKNKIGLVDSSGDFISQKQDVTLVWPYKDCVLEGGQTKDDEKRDEVFYNETLAPDQVTRLLYPKALTSAKRYSYSGGYDQTGKPVGGEGTVACEETTELKDDDNLIIKGNNLLALSSLLRRYEGKVKCIYIDPPYYFSVKKDEDTFAYNSNFKLSSWLVFMKNRLEMAKRLIADDGAIFVQISDDGVGELHCLLKDVFGVENFINKITVKTKSPSGFASVNPGVFETAEYILAFAKNKRNWKYNIQYIESGYDANYKSVVINKDEPADKWIIKNITDVLAEERGYDNAKAIRDDLGKVVVNELIAEYAFKNANSVFRYTAIGNNAGQTVVDARNKSKENPENIFSIERNGQYTVYVHKGQEIAFYSKKLHEVDGKIVPSMQVSNIWTDTPYEGIANEGGVTLKGGKKPEKLIRRIIEMASNKGDLILDYHLGSGTTCAVAHKIGRKYIGIEQLKYGKDDSAVRLKSVIKGDSTGISKAVKWQGGGSFVYCELAERSETLMEQLQSAQDPESILGILDEATEEGLLRPSVLPSDLKKAREEFLEFSLDEQRSLVMELLDKNKLYVNLCDMEDENMDLSEDSKAFTRSFYNLDRDTEV